MHVAGHSKWANIKHRKERADKKKGKIFSRVIKEIISAVRQGGPDPKSNQKLKIAIQKAKDANVPSDNVERNIKKASSSDQGDFVEMTYELYGFGGVGILAEVMTDNKNRIASDVRIATNKCGGTIATPGSVSYNFSKVGLLKVPKSAISEEDLFLLATDIGADDFFSEEENYLLTTKVEDFVSCKEALSQKNLPSIEGEIGWLPKTWIEVDDAIADQNIALIEWLEGIDDVDAVYHNMKVSLEGSS